MHVEARQTELLGRPKRRPHPSAKKARVLGLELEGHLMTPLSPPFLVFALFMCTKYFTNALAGVLVRLLRSQTEKWGKRKRISVKSCASRVILDIYKLFSFCVCLFCASDVCPRCA